MFGYESEISACDKIRNPNGIYLFKAMKTPEKCT